MKTERKEYVAPEYTVVKFDCHSQEMYLPQGD